jgi:hypothetical protein
MEGTNIKENIHLPEDRHGYDFNKRAFYSFLAKHAIPENLIRNNDDVIWK